MEIKTNLLEETEMALQENGKTWGDVRWIGSEDVEIPVEEFWHYANTEYDAGFGGTEVAEDLVIVGFDWWLERYEYDGAEAWKYKTLPTRPMVLLSGPVAVTIDQATTEEPWTMRLKDMNEVAE